MLIRLDTAQPLQQQIYDQIKHAVLVADLAPTTRLPSSRALAAELAVSRNTVLIAYEQLQAEGYIETRPGGGTFVGNIAVAKPIRTAEPAGAMPPPRLSAYSKRLRDLAVGALDRGRGARYNFHYGAVSANDFPADIWHRLLLREVRRRAGRPYLYESPQGLPELRAALSDYLGRARAVRARPEQIVIVNGSQQAIDLTLRVLVDPGAAVVVEDPCYAGARLAIAAYGARLIGVPVDRDGLDVTRLPLPDAATRVAFVTPSHQFPTGAVMTAARRVGLLDWATRSGAYVFEDDYDSEYRYDGRPVASLQALDDGGRVIYCGTVSKLLAPGLRLGYLVLPDALVEPYLRAKQLADRNTAALDQAVLAHLVRDGHFERHIRRSRRRNQDRRDALLAALSAAFGSSVSTGPAEAGLHVLVRIAGIPAGLAASVAEAAALRSVAISPSDVGGDPDAVTFLMGFAALETADISAGVAVLADVVQAFRRG